MGRRRGVSNLNIIYHKTYHIRTKIIENVWQKFAVSARVTSTPNSITKVCSYNVSQCLCVLDYLRKIP